LSGELTKLQSELAVLEQRREAASTLTQLRRKGRTLSQGFDELQTELPQSGNDWRWRAWSPLA
jgi:hypothetical protein